eukprot:12030810-Alexandrium_andersonii.AAC.1
MSSAARKLQEAAEAASRAASSSFLRSPAGSCGFPALLSGGAGLPPPSRPPNKRLRRAQRRHLLRGPWG